DAALGRMQPQLQGLERAAGITSSPSSISSSRPATRAPLWRCAGQRKPSSLGSYCQPPSDGSPSTGSASIGCRSSCTGVVASIISPGQGPLTIGPLYRLRRAAECEEVEALDTQG